MVEVEFLGPIGKESMRIDASTLSDVKELLKQESDLEEWLPNSAIALNDKIVDTLEIELKDGDRISLLPPVCGG
ncbi:MAG: MoaD/ThiS family protein [Campylobacterales bacterium]